jgi:hypothetical protein
MLTIEYDSWNGTSVSDGMIEILIFNWLEDGLTYFKTGSENLILATRALIAEGRIPHTDIQFLFRGQMHKPVQDGRLSEWPSGFCDFSEKWLQKLL